VDQFLTFLERVGVPAGIAYVLLFRIEPALKELTKAVLTIPASITNAIHNCPFRPDHAPEVPS
jgi:hypothetical protein